MKVYAVTGTYHGAIIECNSEGEARRIFHRVYRGESVVNVRLIKRAYIQVGSEFGTAVG